VKKDYQQQWVAIPNVSNISVGIAGNQSDFVVGLTLQVRCPRDVADVETRVPDEIDGVPIARNLQTSLLAGSYEEKQESNCQRGDRP
jgi:hypothetical protein